MEAGSNAESLIERLDHPGFVVSDLDAAMAFFTDILGAEYVRDGTLGDPTGSTMTDVFAVHPRAEARFIFLTFGDRNFELLEWTSPDQDTKSPANSDLGGRHLALKVNDMEAALAKLREVPGVTVRQRSDKGFYYLTTPFGLEMQLMP